MGRPAFGLEASGLHGANLLFTLSLALARACLGKHAPSWQPASDWANRSLRGVTSAGKRKSLFCGTTVSKTQNAVPKSNSGCGHSDSGTRYRCHCDECRARVSYQTNAERFGATYFRPLAARLL